MCIVTAKLPRPLFFKSNCGETWSGKAASVLCFSCPILAAITVFFSFLLLEFNKCKTPAWDNLTELWVHRYAVLCLISFSSFQCLETPESLINSVLGPCKILKVHHPPRQFTCWCKFMNWEWMESKRFVKNRRLGSRILLKGLIRKRGFVPNCTS